MKFTIDIDCTPQEARSFLGLPDLAPIHELYLDRLRAAMAEGISPDDVERMMRAWAPGVSEGLEQWQKIFWQAATGAGRKSG